MRLLICGSREWRDEEFIYDKLVEFVLQHEVAGHPRPSIIEGCNGDDYRTLGDGTKVLDPHGADHLAERAAKRLGLHVDHYPAMWEKYGNRAGPLRNQDMLDHGHPDRVWAFHDSFIGSKGTGDMVARAKRALVPVRIFAHHEHPLPGTSVNCFACAAHLFEYRPPGKLL